MKEKIATKTGVSAVKRFAKDYMSVVGLAILCIIFGALSQMKFGAQYFLTWSNWKNILLQSSTVAIVALGQSIILLTGNFDLSLGRVVCLTSALGAILMKSYGLPAGLVVIIMLLVGILCGAINGFMTAYVGIPAFIATLGTQYVCYGTAKYLTNATPISGMPKSIGWLGRGYILKIIPCCVVIMVVLYIVAQFITTKTKSGRNLYAVGGGREAAFFSGIQVKRVYFGTFVLAGFLAAFGGLVLMSRLDSVATPNGQN